jgi:adhesin transport system membrane fusion protein
MPALQDKVDRAELKAPVAGVVNRVLVTTVGGVIKPGEPVFEVVPVDDQLVVEAMVDPKDIAFVHIGQLAKVKITAYDYSIYGAMDGRVTQISPDAVPVGDKGQTFYQVRVETNAKTIDSLGQKLPILPGMQAQIDIVTGSKTILQYITKPLVGVKENAFRER